MGAPPNGNATSEGLQEPEKRAIRRHQTQIRACRPARRWRYESARRRTGTRRGPVRRKGEGTGHELNCNVHESVTVLFYCWRRLDSLLLLRQDICRRSLRAPAFLWSRLSRVADIKARWVPRRAVAKPKHLAGKVGAGSSNATWHPAPDDEVNPNASPGCLGRCP